MAVTINGSAPSAAQKASLVGAFDLQTGKRSRLKSAMDAWAAGYRTRPPIILGIGDSNFTGEGAGSGGPTNLNGAFAASPIQQMATALGTLNGNPVRNTMWFGEGNITANGASVALYDPRLTLGSGWAADSYSASILGARHLINPTSGSGFLTFNCGSALTDVEVHYPVNTTSLSTSVGIYASDNTLLGSMNQIGGAQGIASLKVTSSKLSDGIVKIRNDASGTAFIAGMIGWNSAEDAVIVGQGTWSGALVSDINNTIAPWAGTSYIKTILPDLVITGLTINDIVNSTSTTTFASGMTTLMGVISTYADSVLATGAPGGGTNYTSSTHWRDIERELIKVAAAFGSEFVSMHRVFDNYAALDAAGFAYNNVPHLTSSGYAVQASVLAEVVRGMAR